MLGLAESKKVVVVGIPGVGKTTVVSKVVEKLNALNKSVSVHSFGTVMFEEAKEDGLKDRDDLRKLTVNKDYSDKGRETNIRNAQMIAEYAHNNGCDVVVSVVAPFRKLREEFKDKISTDIAEIYLHTTEKRERYKFRAKDYEAPEINFIDIDTTEDSPDISFSKIVISMFNT